ncbi:MAG: hypothetical protein ABR874_03340 [Candidatus Sulfotelmatobacter sp.]
MLAVYSALFFSIDPLTYVSWTVANSDAVYFAPGEEVNDISIDQRDLFQVQSNSIVALLMIDFLYIKKPLQLMHMLEPDSAG